MQGKPWDQNSLLFERSLTVDLDACLSDKTALERLHLGSEGMPTYRYEGLWKEDYGRRLFSTKSNLKTAQGAYLSPASRTQISKRPSLSHPVSHPCIPHYMLIRFGPSGLDNSGALLTCATLQDHQHGLGVEERDYEPLPIEI